MTLAFISCNISITSLNIVFEEVKTNGEIQRDSNKASKKIFGSTQVMNSLKH